MASVCPIQRGILSIRVHSPSILSGCRVTQSKQVDVIIVGGGMVGAALAIGLAQQQYKVALIEKHALHPFSPEQAPDIRMSAFNMHSVNLLTQLGAWQHIEGMRYKEYSRLSVWEDAQHHTIFDATEVGHDKLGYFVENRLVQLALYQQIEAVYAGKIECVHGQDVTHIDIQTACVKLASGVCYQASVVIGADGAQSQVRQAAGIGTLGWQYAQQANAIVIETPQQVQNETWQEFHPEGPRALLPMHNNYACLVWYDSVETSKWIQQADKKALKLAICNNFPKRLPDFNIVQVAGFGLTRMHAKHYGRGACVILGDAAHTINPLAGQGVNLGFKDVSALLNIVSEQGLQDCANIISAFEKQRRLPNLLMMSTMDLLYKTFSTPSTPMRKARNIALKIANNAGPLKQKALKYAMGL